MDAGPVEQSIKHSIEKNGFPEKTVRLPFKPVYDSCKRHATSLSAVLKNLEVEQIFGKIQGNHIAFHSREQLEAAAKQKANPKPDTSSPGTDGDLFEAAKQSLDNLTPEQLAQIQNQVNNLSEEEKQNLMKLVAEQFKPKS